MQPVTIIVGFGISFFVLVAIVIFSSRRKAAKRSATSSPRILVSTTQNQPRRLQRRQSPLLPTYEPSPPTTTATPFQEIQQHRQLGKTINNEPGPRLFSSHSTRAATIRQADQDRRRQSGLSTSWAGQSRVGERLDSPLPAVPQPVAAPARVPSRMTAGRTGTVTEADPPPPYVA
jgi:hypothetical protein